MRGARTIQRYAVLAALAAGLLVQPALAEDTADPLAGLSVVEEAELLSLSGRQGVSISDQDLIATTQGGSVEAGEDVETGGVHFGSSMQRMHGLNNQAINTGNNANVVAGMAVHIHLH